MPKVSEFLPVSGHEDVIVLTVDEYESIRLIDRQGFSQEACAACMQVQEPRHSRFTTPPGRKSLPLWWTERDFVSKAAITVCATERKLPVIAEAAPDIAWKINNPKDGIQK